MPTLSNNRQIVLLQTLGSGGFGAVYLAELRGEDGFAQRVALKILHASHARVSDLAARQRDEARLLARLNHDHIVKVLDLVSVQGRPAVIMEYVEGVDASHLIGRGPLPPRAALEIVAGAASALTAAVETPHPDTGRPLRVVHRDIKPANLLITAAGGLKVLDFGVARADLDREGRTESVAFGTARYMAAETFLTGEVSPAVDIYALGVTFAELLLGSTVERAPLASERHAPWREEVLATARRALPPDSNPEWIERALGLLSESLSWGPEGRPSASDLYHRAWDLAEVAPGEGLRRYARRVVPPILAEQRAKAEPPPVLEDAQVQAPPSPTEWGRTLSGGSPSPEPAPPATAPIPPSETAPEPPRRKSRALLGVAALALLGLGLALVMKGTGTPQPTEAPATPPPVEVAAAPVEAPPVEPAPSEPAPAVAPTPKAAPSRPAPTTPAPAPSPALRCADTPADGLVPVRISSDPLGAEVYLDSTRLGATPLISCLLPEGQYRLQLRASDGRRGERALTVSRRSPPNTLWRAAEDRWEALY